MQAFQLIEGFENLAVLVFDVLAFIQHDVLKFHLLQHLHIAQGRLVGGEDDIEARQQANVFVALLPGMPVHLQGRGELLNLGLPVEHQRCRQDDQGLQRLKRIVVIGGCEKAKLSAGIRVALCFGFLLALCPLRLGMEEHRDGLQGFAQPHVVGQAATELTFVKTYQPSCPFQLIRAE